LHHTASSCADGPEIGNQGEENANTAAAAVETGSSGEKTAQP